MSPILNVYEFLNLAILVNTICGLISQSQPNPPAHSFQTSNSQNFEMRMSQNQSQNSLLFPKNMPVFFKSQANPENVENFAQSQFNNYKIRLPIQRNVLTNQNQTMQQFSENAPIQLARAQMAPNPLHPPVLHNPHFLEKPIVNNRYSMNRHSGLATVFSEPQNSTLSVNRVRNPMAQSHKFPTRFSVGMPSCHFRPPSFLQVPSKSTRASAQTLEQNPRLSRQSSNRFIQLSGNPTAPTLIQAQDATKLLGSDTDIQRLISGSQTSNPFMTQPAVTGPIYQNQGFVKVSNQMDLNVGASIRDEPTPPLSVALPESQKIFFAGFREAPKVEVKEQSVLDATTVASSGDVGSLFEKMAKSKIVFEELNNIQKLNFKLKEALNTYHCKKM